MRGLAVPGSSRSPPAPRPSIGQCTPGSTAPAAQVGLSAMAIRPALQMAGGGRGAERRYVILYAGCAGRSSGHPPFPAVAGTGKQRCTVGPQQGSPASCHHLHAHLALAVQFHPPGLLHTQDKPPAYCHTPDGPSKWEGQGSPHPQKQAGTPLSTLPEPSPGGFPYAARFLLGSSARPGHRMSVPWEIKGWARHLPTSRASRSPCHHLGTSAQPERDGKAPPVDQALASAPVLSPSARDLWIPPQPHPARTGNPNVSDVKLTMPTWPCQASHPCSPCP